MVALSTPNVHLINRLLALTVSVVLAAVLLSSLGLFLAEAAPQAATPAAGETCFASLGTTTEYSSTTAQALRDALAAAGPGSVVKVAGTCAGVITGTVTDNEVAEITKTLTVRGGYSTTNWLTNNPATNPTVLDAQGGGRVLYITASNVTLDGLTIKNGIAPNQTNADGGGVRVSGNTAFTLTNSIVMSNATQGLLSDGGGLYIVGGSAAIYNSRFERNAATFSFGDGGGVYVQGSLVLSNTDFISNTAYSGGAASAQNLLVAGGVFSNNQASVNAGALFASTYLTLTDAAFYNNSISDGSGGAIKALTGFSILRGTFVQNHSGFRGGALNLQNGGAASWITATTFLSNTATDVGGALHLIGNTGDEIRLANNVFGGNVSADEGGALFGEASNNTTFFHLSANSFISNTATNGGGALYFGNGSVAFLENNVLARNTATQGSTDLGLGGSSQPATVVATHNTFVAFSASSGPAVEAGYDVTNETLLLTNSIFDGYALGVVKGTLPATVLVDGVLWFNVALPTYSYGSAISVTNAYTGDPSFISRAADNYHLLAFSAALNRGVSSSVTVDFDGNTRPFGSAPDLGFDEFVGGVVYLPIIRK